MDKLNDQYWNDRKVVDVKIHYLEFIHSHSGLILSAQMW